MPDLIVHTTAGPRAGLRLSLPAGEAVAIQLDGPPHVPEGSTVIPVFQYVHAARRLDPLDTPSPPDRCWGTSPAPHCGCWTTTP